MSIVDTLQDLDWSDRTVQLGAAGAVAVVGFVAWQVRKGGQPGGDQGPAPAITIDRDGFGSRSDARDAFGDAPGVIGWVGNQPSQPPPLPQTPTTPEPKAGVLTVLRGGLPREVRAAPLNAAVNCPAGYVAVQNQDGTYRCSVADDRNLPADRPATFRPGGAFDPYKAAGQGGAGPMATDPNPYGNSPFTAGSVGGFSPFPAPIAGGQTVAVRAGESVKGVASRVYGSEDLWPRIARMNPELYQGELSEGDALKVM